MVFKNKNYSSIIVGRITSNIGDSLMLQLIPLYIIATSSSNVNELISFNGFLIYLPYFFLPLIAHNIEKFKSKKKLMLILESSNLLLVLMLLASIFFKANIYLTLIICFGSYTIYALNHSVQNALVANVVDEDDYFSFFRVFELSGSILDAVLDALATWFIQLTGFIFSLIIDIFTFINSIFFFNRVTETKLAVQKPINKVPISILKKDKEFFNIIILEAIMNGFVTLSIILLPVYLNELKLLYLYPVFLLMKGLCGIVGVYLSKFLRKININLIFASSFLLYGISFSIFLMTTNIFIMAISFFFAYLLFASTSPFYSERMMSTFEEQIQVQVTTYIQFLLVISILVTTLISSFTFLPTINYLISSIVVAIGSGIYLLIYKYWSKNTI